MPSNRKQEPGADLGTGTSAPHRSGGRRAGEKAAKIGLRGSVVRNPEQREEQRRQILAAAGRVFARKGYEGATMDDIATEMGGSKGILYYQFQSKQDLIVETRRVASGGAAERLEAIALRPVPFLERMEAAVRDLIVTNFDELSRHVILTSISLGLDKAHVAKVRAIERRYETAFIALLEEGMATGLLAPANVKATLFTVIQTCLSPARWFREGEGASAEEVTSVVTDMVMRGLRPRPPG
ncbi:MAG: TetR family transcriptional regulator [Phreatobacter sp.]